MPGGCRRRWGAGPYWPKNTVTAQAPVAVKFHRFLLEPDVCGQSLGQAQLGFGGGALAFRLFQHLCHGVAGGPQMLRAEIRCHAGVFGHKIRFPFNALLEALLPWNHDRV